MSIKSQVLKEVKLRASRAKQGKDGVRKVIKPGSSADLANYMERHKNDKFK